LPPQSFGRFRHGLLAGKGIFVDPRLIDGAPKSHW
jgi:hypothetical protein